MHLILYCQLVYESKNYLRKHFFPDFDSLTLVCWVLELWGFGWDTYNTVDWVIHRLCIRNIKFIILEQHQIHQNLCFPTHMRLLLLIYHSDLTTNFCLTQISSHIIIIQELNSILLSFWGQWFVYEQSPTGVIPHIPYVWRHRHYFRKILCCIRHICQTQTFLFLVFAENNLYRILEINSELLDKYAHRSIFNSGPRYLKTVVHCQ